MSAVMSPPKLRFRFDVVKRVWRHLSGDLAGRRVNLCRFCKLFSERMGTCIACQNARNAEIKQQRRIFTNAVRAGKIPSLADRQTPCVDCKGTSKPRRPATEWDHRDWREPLKVEPVCRFHNSHRGRAMTAHEASFQRKVA